MLRLIDNAEPFIGEKFYHYLNVTSEFNRFLVTNQNKKEWQSNALR